MLYEGRDGKPELIRIYVRYEIMRTSQQECRGILEKVGWQKPDEIGIYVAKSRYLEYDAKVIKKNE